MHLPPSFALSDDVQYGEGMWRFAAGALCLYEWVWGKQVSERISAYTDRLGHEADDMDDYACTYNRRLSTCNATICDDEAEAIAAGFGDERATARSISTFTIC
jgi:hypothetical protein